MKKWIRNIAIGMGLGMLKDVEIVKKLLAFLKTKKVWVGRAGMIIFTALAAAKYFYPTLPIDDSIEIVGIIFSWLAIEIGLNQTEIKEIEDLGNKPFDPTKPISIDGVEFPSAETIESMVEKVKTITSDSDKNT